MGQGQAMKERIEIEDEVVERQRQRKVKANKEEMDRRGFTCLPGQ